MHASLHINLVARKLQIHTNAYSYHIQYLPVQVGVMLAARQQKSKPQVINFLITMHAHIIKIV